MKLFKFKRPIFYTIVLGMVTLAIVFSSCSQNKIRANATLDERMDMAMKMFERGDYFDAKTQLRIITLSRSGSLKADSAQFYYAECHFHMKEYILAASEYERLINVYPASEFVDDAKFKLGLSYFKLSPKYSLDQEYTYQAIRHFQEFLEDYYGADPKLTQEVEQHLNEARDKLARKVYESAEIYRKMNYYRSARIYYNKVLEEYFDTQYAPRALYWVGECNRRLEDYQEAMSAFDEFINKYQNHEWLPRVRSKIKQTREDYEDSLNKQQES